MDLTDLNNLKNEVQDLLSVAKIELEERRLQQQREEKVQEEIANIEREYKPMLETLEQMLGQFGSDDFTDSLTRQKLEDKAEQIRKILAEAPLLAAQAVDRQMILHEERLLDERQSEQTRRWREELKADLLEMIGEQRDFFSATDAAIAIKGYVIDLKAIGALEEVVEALMLQINTHSKEGPVARLRDNNYELTLNFIYNKALENRSRVDRSADVQPRTRHRSSEKQPKPYTSLAGKVVIFGGHDRLETAVRNRLRDSNVNLIWCTAQGGPQLAEQGESHVPTADLVLIITGYASHKLTDKAMQAMQRCGKTPQMINTTGMTRILEAIEYGLKAKQLLSQFKKSA